MGRYVAASLTITGTGPVGSPKWGPDMGGRIVANDVEAEKCGKCGGTGEIGPADDKYICPWCASYSRPTLPPSAGAESTHGPGACLPVAAIEADRAVAGREQDERERWIRADERERCARVCDERAEMNKRAAKAAIGRSVVMCLIDHAASAVECAAAIRAPAPPPKVES